MTNNLWHSHAVPPDYIPTRDRKSIRLPGYDYSTAGYYFITVHTVPGTPALSRADESGTYVNGLGRTVQRIWTELPKRFQSCSTDVFSLQPNHFHGIIVIDDASQNVLGEIMRAFKSLSAIAINKQLERSGAPVWQRGFYERVIRDEGELERARQYIAFNELKTVQQRDKARRAAQS